MNEENMMFEDDDELEDYSLNNNNNLVDKNKHNREDLEYKENHHCNYNCYFAIDFYVLLELTFFLSESLIQSSSLEEKNFLRRIWTYCQSQRTVLQ